MTHFAKVFGIAWVIIIALYIFVVFRVGFAVGWHGQQGQTPPSRFVFEFIFYAWPVIPAALIATIWELARVAMSRKYLGQHP